MASDNDNDDRPFVLIELCDGIRGSVGLAKCAATGARVWMSAVGSCDQGETVDAEAAAATQKKSWAVRIP